MLHLQIYLLVAFDLCCTKYELIFLGVLPTGLNSFWLGFEIIFIYLYIELCVSDYADFV